MEELYIVKDVCENPSQTNFLKLTDRTKKFFNKASRICVKKSFGNVEFAKKIISVFFRQLYLQVVFQPKIKI